MELLGSLRGVNRLNAVLSPPCLDGERRVVRAVLGHDLAELVTREQTGLLQQVLLAQPERRLTDSSEQLPHVGWHPCRERLAVACAWQ